MQNLRELREVSGLSQFAAASRAGVSRVRLSLHECGEIELTPEEAKRVREVLFGAVREQSARLKVVLSEAATT